MDQNNKFQPTKLWGDTNVPVVQRAANRAGGAEHRNVRTMNNSIYKLGRTTKRKEFHEEDKGPMRR